jgi:signal transduction histidine kinase
MFDEFTVLEIRKQLGILAGHASLLHWGRTSPEEVVRVAKRLLHATACIDALMGVALGGGDWVEGIVLDGERAPPVTIAGGVVEHWTQEAKRRRVTLALEVAAGSTAPETMLHEVPLLAVELVLGNLLHNAITHGPNGGRVALRVTSRAAHVVFEVMDEGPGIPPTRVAALFGRRLRSTTKEGAPASRAGLGLALSRSLAKRMGGALSYETGRAGPCFVLVVPVHVEPPRTHGQTGASVSTISPPRTNTSPGNGRRL